jgi:hypothetical protein
MAPISVSTITTQLFELAPTIFDLDIEVRLREWYQCTEIRLPGSFN